MNTIMNTAAGYARLNITLPKDITEYMRRNTKNISKYVSEAISERVAREKREKAFREIVAGPPSFDDIEDSVAYVRELRAENEERMKRIGV
jgi:post-segregation antitoxin (ccd killing protein)